LNLKFFENKVQLDSKYRHIYEELKRLKRQLKDNDTDHNKRYMLRSEMDKLERDWKLKLEQLHLTREPIRIGDEKEKDFAAVSSKHDHSEDDYVRISSRASSNHTTITTSRGNNDLSVSEKLIKLRRELPQIEIGEEVIAKWCDDGWYYRSIVKDYLGDGRYLIEDANHDVEEIDRDDIISEENDTKDMHRNYESGDPVVALHPNYAHSYAPGQIVQVNSNNNTFNIRFYDHFEGHNIKGNDVYKMHRLKFQLDIDNIIELEKAWIGQVVVARNNLSNCYEIGKVVGQETTNRSYTIEWWNGQTSIQNANHIFGQLTRRPTFNIQDFVLAQRENIYLPGRIIGKQNGQLCVKFVDNIL
jgi:hypothetical protein